mgnify:CR=1 FL=1
MQRGDVRIFKKVHIRQADAGIQAGALHGDRGSLKKERVLSVVQRAYARLGIYGRWIGLRFADSATPDERRRHLVSRLPEIEQPINTITHAYIADRYAAPPEPPQRESSRRQAHEAWQAARWAFVRRKVALWLGLGREDE